MWRSCGNLCPLGTQGCVPVGSEPQGAGGQLSQGLGWANGGKKGEPAPGPLSTRFLHSFPRYLGHSPVSKGVSNFQWARLCPPVLPFIPMALICGTRLRPCAPGPFFLSVKGWALSLSDGMGEKWPGELSSPRHFLCSPKSLPEEPSAFHVRAW